MSSFFAPLIRWLTHRPDLTPPFGCERCHYTTQSEYLLALHTLQVHGTTEQGGRHRHN